MTEGESAQSFKLSMVEFVMLTAFMMAITALSVDIMLPVLPDIVKTFELDDPNKQQFMVTAYLAMFAIGQIFAGPLSDRFGRRPVVLGGLGIYLVGTVLSVVADSYALLLVARTVQGFGAAGPRVVAVAIVRDRFVGRAMSQVMSFVMTIFIILPVLAPSIGVLIDSLGSWRYVFLFLLIFAAGTAAWTALRLPETNPRGPGSPAPVPLGKAVSTIWHNPQTMGYMIALGFIFGCLMTYVSTTQQIFQDIYGIVDWFPVVFGSVAFMMIVASFVNARLVRTMGMRRLSHAAALAFMVLSILGFAASFFVEPLPLAVLMILLGLSFFFMGLVLPNFNALAMEPLGRVAGTGSSFIGFVMTALGAFLGGAAGQFYHGTLGHLLGAYLVYSVAVVLIVYKVEGGRLMQPTPLHAE